MASSSKLSLICCLALLTACSSAKKKTTPELSEMEGKRVALVEIDGEDTARKIVEVALINQLIQSGKFIIISKQDLNKARAATDLDPRDWKKLARRVDADYALRAKVLKFAADVHEGYSAVEEEDSQLAEERGEKEGKAERIYKVKSLDGEVQVELEFTQVNSSSETRKAVAEAKEQVIEEAKKSAIHLPPSLRFLENLTNRAFKEFFERYN